jgi:hypothetical protein
LRSRLTGNISVAHRDRKRLLEVFMANAGRVLTNSDLAERLGDHSDSWTRRLRELREPRFGGYEILTHNTSSELKPGEYLFPPQAYKEPSEQQRLKAATRAEVLLRDAYTCQYCGLTRGQRYEDETPVSLRVRALDAKSGDVTASRCLTMCSKCFDAEDTIRTLRPPKDKLFASFLRLSTRDRIDFMNQLHDTFSDASND